MGVSNVWYRKKAICHLGLPRSPGNKFRRPFDSKYKYCIFLYEFFSFYENVASAHGHAGLFLKYFTIPQPLQPK